MKVNIDGVDYSLNDGAWSSDSNDNITAELTNRLDSIVESTQTLIATGVSDDSEKKVVSKKGKGKIKIFDN